MAVVSSTEAKKQYQDDDEYDHCVWCAITTFVLMQRPFPTSTRDAVRPARLCDALGDPAEADVDARSRAGKEKAGLVSPVPDSYELGHGCNAVPNG
jgi:hypothetical protein